MRVLVFDVFGRYALFRRSYTTTSSTSYDFPPRTAVCGLMGAVLGLTNKTSDSSEHLRHFDSAHIALRLLKPVRKTCLGVNYVETKTGKENRTQILLEVIKDPATGSTSASSNCSNSCKSTFEMVPVSTRHTLARHR